MLNQEPPCRKDYYSVLNVAHNASQQEIREAFFRLKNTYADDNQALYSLVNDDDIEKTLAEIEEAFRILSDEKKRSKYDKSNAETDSEAETDSHQKSKANETPGESEPFMAFFEKPKKPRLKRVCSNAKDSEIVDKIDEIIKHNEICDGALFRKIRKTLGASLHDIQDNIKVSIGYLKAIEENSFDYLPQPVYVKGFLKSYLHFLGVKKAEPLVNAFIERMESCNKNGRS